MSNANDFAKHSRKTILVVEDDTGVGAFLVEALKTEGGYQALLVANGTQAFERIKTLAPDLFLLDYRLPDIDGLELADRLRAIDEFQQTPILLMSAATAPKEREKNQIPFLEKPFELDTFLQAVEESLQRDSPCIS